MAAGNSGPVPLVQVDEKTGEFAVSRAAAASLAKVKGRICVVVVAGPARTGKSFLLNRLIGAQQSGFTVGKTIRSCTKGIWLWGAPAEEGGITYVFLDTEGLGSLEQSSTYDTQLFSLALLLASTFILNTTGTIDESTLEQLQLVCECTNRIRETSGSEGSDLSPDLVWVLRDFMLKLEDEAGNPMTPSQYLEDSLRPRPGTSARIKDKNVIRETIGSFFPARTAHCLVRPILDETALQELDRVPWKSLRPEFKEGIQALRQAVYAHSKAKTVNGNFVNGRTLVRLTEAYVESLNAGAVPVIQTAWQSVVAASAHEAVEAGVQAYEAVLTQGAGDILSSTALDELHTNAEQAGVAAVLELAVGGDDVKQAALSKLRDITSKRIAEVRQFNKLRAINAARALADKLWAKYKFDSEPDSITGLNHERALAEFAASVPAGPGVDEVRVELGDRLSARATRAAERVAARQEQMAKEWESKMAVLSSELTAAQANAKAVTAEYKQKLAAAEAAASTATQSVETQVARVERDAAKRVASVEAEFVRKLGELTAAHATEVAELKAEYSRRAGAEGGKSAQKIAGLESEVSSLKATINELRTTVAELRVSETRAIERAEAAELALVTAQSQVAAAIASTSATSPTKTPYGAAGSTAASALALEDTSMSGDEFVDALDESADGQGRGGSKKGKGKGSSTKPAAKKKAAAPKRASKRKRADSMDLDAGGDDGADASNPTEEALARAAKSTKQQLKSWLTELNVELPVHDVKKDVLLDMVFENVSELNGLTKDDLPSAKKKRRR